MKTALAADSQTTTEPLQYGSLLLASATTIFVGSFLLFQVQPVIARYILPWFGGTHALRTTCILFFQVLLLAWILMTSNREFLDQAAAQLTADEYFMNDNRAIQWTDDYSSLAGLFY